MDRSDGYDFDFDPFSDNWLKDLKEGKSKLGKKKSKTSSASAIPRIKPSRPEKPKIPKISSSSAIPRVKPLRPKFLKKPKSSPGQVISSVKPPKLEKQRSAKPFLPPVIPRVKPPKPEKAKKNKTSDLSEVRQKWKSDTQEQFNTWLEEVLRDEEPPGGMAPELLTSSNPDEDTGIDMFSLWSATTALTTEVKLQGRSFNQLHNTLASVATVEKSVESALTLHSEAMSHASSKKDLANQISEQWKADIVRQSERRQFKQTLDTLLDVRDRLKRGLETAQTNLEWVKSKIKRSFFLRIFSKTTRALLDTSIAYEKGYMMSLERLDETLKELGVSEIECEGVLFDPHKMRTVEIEITSDVASGTVLAVYRPGYEWEGRVLRHAEVKVSKEDKNTSAPNSRLLE